MVSSAETGALRPPPVMVAVLLMALPSARGANWLTRASYTSTALLPAGMLMPEITRGGSAVAEGAGWSTPLMNSRTEPGI